MQNIFKFIIRRPLVVMVFIIAIFFSAATGLKNFKLDASSDALVIGEMKPLKFIERQVKYLVIRIS